MHSLPVTIDKARNLTRAIAFMLARAFACLLVWVAMTMQGHAANPDSGKPQAAPGPAAAAPGTPQLAALTAAITPQVRRAYPQASTVEVRATAAALRLVPTCAGGLVADLQAQRLHGNLSARVYCAGNAGAAGQSVRLPVQVEVHVPMLVANGAIARGALLDAGAVSMRDTPLGNGSDFLTDAASAIGQRTRAALRAGQPNSARHLEAGDDVTAGQQVALAAGGADFSVTVAGQALQGGRTGEQIRVRNLATGRVVAAWVTGRGRTHTRPPDGPAPPR